jgi:putative transposase
LTWASTLGGHVAADVFTVDLLNGTRVYYLAVIEHATRRIHILGATANPMAGWFTQQARSLLVDLEEYAEAIKFLIRDRDSKFVTAFDAVFKSVGIRIIQTPIQAPRANAIRELESVAADLPQQLLERPSWASSLVRQDLLRGPK